jgi:acetyl esterase/lipase
MEYRYDKELMAAIPSFGIFDLTNPAQTREKLRIASKGRPAPDATGVDVKDYEAPGPDGGGNVFVRVYRPTGIETKLPVVLNIHGGGFVIGRVEVDDGRCLEMARQIPALIVSVGYRLAPENPYPAALEDCYAALIWIAGRAADFGADAARVGVHGISAGGGLAAALALLARDKGGPRIIFQYLDMPQLDDRRASVSMRRFTDTPGWNSVNAEISWRYYLGDIVGRDTVPIYAAPARAKDLTGLPDAYVGALEYDPLRSEAVMYAEALFAAGVSVELHVMPSAYHLAYLVPNAKVERRRADERIAVLRRALCEQY